MRPPTAFLCSQRWPCRVFHSGYGARFYAHGRTRLFRFARKTLWTEASWTLQSLGAWIMLGTSSAVAVTGGVLVWLGVRDANKVKDAKAGSAWSSLESAEQRAPILSGVGYAAIGLGVAGAIGSMVWLLSNSSNEVQTSVGIHGIRIRGRF